MCCIFDTVKRTRGWKPDPKLSENDNMFFAAVHFTQVFFGRYKINRHNNEHDFDDMASDCSLEVYESAKRNIGKWDRGKYRMDQYMYGRSWSVVGHFLQRYFLRKQRELLDVKLGDNRLTSVEFDVGTDEIGSNNYEQGTRYTVFRPAPLSYEEKKLTEDELEYVRMVDDCVYEGLPIPTLEDFDLEDSKHKATIQKILGANYVGLNESPERTTKCSLLSSKA